MLLLIGHLIVYSMHAVISAAIGLFSQTMHAKHVLECSTSCNTEDVDVTFRLALVGEQVSDQHVLVMGMKSRLYHAFGSLQATLFIEPIMRCMR